MKTIVFINTQKSGSSREALQTSRRMGYETVLLTKKLSQINNRNLFPEVSKMILCDIDDFEALRFEIKQLQKANYELVSIISFIDPYCFTASKLAELFGINHFSTEAINKMQDKKLSRACLKGTPYTPWYSIIHSFNECLSCDVRERLPLMIKNPQSSGSRDVILVNSMAEFYDNVKRLLSLYPYQVIIEQYIEGEQYLVETIVENNKIHIIAIIEQEIFLYNGHSIVIGYNLKHNLKKEFQLSLGKAVHDIINLHGMEQGTCHLELRYINNNWKLIEINPRISGGAMNDIIRYGLGINLVEETLKLALKEELNITPKYALHINAQYLTCNFSGKLLKVTGRNEALNSQGVINVFIKPTRGQFISVPVAMGFRYAYVLANGISEQDALVKAKRALNKIKLHVLKE